jgi:uncharacterized protein (TIGR03435 family)
LTGGSVFGQWVQLSDIAEFLWERLGMPVQDQTGLKGQYNFKLSWVASDTELGLNGTPARAGDGIGPTLFMAVQEQLGLKLESRRVPIEAFVIDSAERPAQN